MAEPWPPTRYSKPLTPDFQSAADKLLPALQLAWRVAMGYQLDNFQVELVRSVLEICPGWHPRAGKLRYRQVLISVGRQNGKTEIAAFLGLLIMLLKVSALVIGIASSAEQARLVYQRTMTVIRLNAALVKRFARLTDTRGIETKTGGRYEIKAAKGAALQGLPIDLGIDDKHPVLLLLIHFGSTFSTVWVSWSIIMIVMNKSRSVPLFTTACKPSFIQRFITAWSNSLHALTISESSVL